MESNHSCLHHRTIGSPNLTIHNNNNNNKNNSIATGSPATC